MAPHVLTSTQPRSAARRATAPKAKTSVSKVQRAPAGLRIRAAVAPRLPPEVQVQEAERPADQEREPERHSRAAQLAASGGASDPGGPELGAVCYDNDVSETVLTCAEGYCDRALNCTDREPPHCTRVCACHAKGDACRQVNADGSVPLDEPCCDDMVCMKNGLASSGGTEVYTCELPGTLACNVDCQVRLAETPCGSDPSANVMWTCRTAPPEVLEHCMDRGTQIPSWCCPSTVLPECISQ
jgi:hypothetical protein